MTNGYLKEELDFAKNGTIIQMIKGWNRFYHLPKFSNDLIYERIGELINLDYINGTQFDIVMCNEYLKGYED